MTQNTLIYLILTKQFKYLGSECMPVENVGAIDEESARVFDVDKNQQHQPMRHEVSHNFSNFSQDLLKESGNILRNVGKS